MTFRERVRSKLFSAFSILSLPTFTAGSCLSRKEISSISPAQWMIIGWRELLVASKESFQLAMSRYNEVIILSQAERKIRLLCNQNAPHRCWGWLNTRSWSAPSPPRQLSELRLCLITRVRPRESSASTRFISYMGRAHLHTVNSDSLEWGHPSNPDTLTGPKAGWPD